MWLTVRKHDITGKHSENLRAKRVPGFYI